MDEWKEGINRLRMTTYAELLKRAVTAGIPEKDFADAFFRSDESAPSPGEEPPGTPPTTPK